MRYVVFYLYWVLIGVYGVLYMYAIDSILKFEVCPAGYFGFNCSSECNPPSYGLGCVERCDCDPCHHVYGCNLTLSTRGKDASII